MENQQMIAKRINYFCRKEEMTYYQLSYKSTVPLTTLLHIMDCTTKNPGVFTIAKICSGLGITMRTFFDDPAFTEFGWEAEQNG